MTKNQGQKSNGQNIKRPKNKIGRKSKDKHTSNAIFGFLFVLGLINVAGALVCGLGLLVTVPFTTCAIAAAYEHIFGLSNAEDSFA